MLVELHSASSFRSSLLTQGQLRQFGGNGPGGQWPFLRIPKAIEALRAEIALINQQVFSIYNEIPSKRELLESGWLDLLNGLPKNSDIFTTNYDLVIENAIRLVDKCGLENGRESDGVRQQIALHNWDTQSSQARTGILTKLHGSVDWLRRGSQVFGGSPVFAGHENHVVLYPGLKDGEAEVEPFASFHHYLAEILRNTSIVVVIGFGFRDPTIDRMFVANLSSSAEVFLVNPDDSLPVCLNGRNVHLEGKKFTRSYAQELAVILRRKLEGPPTSFAPRERESRSPCST